MRATRRPRLFAASRSGRQKSYRGRNNPEIGFCLPGRCSRVERERVPEPERDIGPRSAWVAPDEIRRNVGTAVVSGPARNSDGSNQAFSHLLDDEPQRLPFALSGTLNRADSRTRRNLEQNGMVYLFLMLPARH